MSLNHFDSKLSVGGLNSRNQVKELLSTKFYGCTYALYSYICEQEVEVIRITSRTRLPAGEDVSVVQYIVTSSRGIIFLSDPMT
jgi:hypothetical protein